ncbi:MAG: hypothetical protein QXJ28_02945, partial [Candidatus Pacearchaeota archaeon]
KIIKEFQKETDWNESVLCRDNGFDYVKGNNSLNNFLLGDKRVVVEICSDHGKQLLPDDTFVELVIACDSCFFFRNNLNPFLERRVVICNGADASSTAFYFNKLSSKIRENIEEVFKNRYLDVYLLNR